MKKLLALVFALLAGSAFAADGYMFGGVCYDTAAKAGLALHEVRTRPVPFVAVAASGTGGALAYTYGVARDSCTVSTSGAVATLLCSPAFSGRFGVSSFSSGTPTGVVVSGAGGGAAVSLSYTFPVCSQSSSLTAADGVSAGWQVGGIWIAVAAVLFMAGVIRRFT